MEDKNLEKDIKDLVIAYKNREWFIKKNAKIFKVLELLDEKIKVCKNLIKNHDKLNIVYEGVTINTKWIVTNRFDSIRFKKEQKDLYDNYIKKVITKKVTVKNVVDNAEHL